MRIIILICLFAFIVFSCSRNERVNYETPEFPFEKELSFEIINDDFIFGNIAFISIYDSSLIIVGSSMCNYVVHIFSRNDGDFIVSTGKIGQGPGELVNPWYFSFDQKNGRLFVHDVGKNAVVVFDMDGVTSYTNPTIEEFRFNNDEPILNSSRFLRDSLFLLDLGRPAIAIGTKHRVFDGVEVPTHPDFRNIDDWQLFLLMNSLLAINPAGDRFVIGTTIGGILYIYSVNDYYQINLETARYFYRPVFTRRGVAFDIDDSERGFSGFYLSDRFIYSIICGVRNPTEFPRNISVFDYKGNPVIRYNTNFPIRSIVVDKYDRYVYAAVFNQDGELALGRAALSPK